MSNDLILLTEADNSWNCLDWTCSLGGVPFGTDHASLEESDGWMIVVLDQYVLDAFEEDERAILNGYLRNPVAYALQWRGDQVLSRFLQKIPCPELIVVNNDHGILTPLETVLEYPLASWIRSCRLPLRVIRGYKKD